MVIIHTADDIIRAMDENPEWLEAVRARILTSELLGLPRRFEDLSVFVERIAATQNAMLETQNKILAEQAEMKATQIAMLATQDRILAEQAEMKATLKEHTDTLGMLKGGEVERMLGKQIYGLLGGPPLRMKLIRVLRGYYWTQPMDRFNGALEKAYDDGKISGGQHDRLIHTDFIASMRRRESTEILYIAIEASGKINSHDVDRAVRSQDALKAAFDGAEALAAVYGWEISEEDKRYAEASGATVFISDPER